MQLRYRADGNHVIELHHLQGIGHNEGLIVAYFPKEKIRVEADAWKPTRSTRPLAWSDENAPPPTAPTPTDKTSLEVPIYF